LRLGERSFIRHVAAAAHEGGCDPVIVVLGAEAELILPELSGSPARAVLHHGWKEGMASSLRAGVAAAAEDPTVEAVLLLTCDQPKLDGGIVRRMLDAFDGTPASMAACEYSGTLGVPALFGRSLFPDLAALHGDRGARQLLRRHEGEVARVDWPDGALDIDTPEDYEAFRSAEGV
jgi:molybdenum cofactor cytidylyltransferase